MAAGVLQRRDGFHFAGQRTGGAEGQGSLLGLNQLQHLRDVLR
jgi:hypothetical protein